MPHVREREPAPDDVPEPGPRRAPADNGTLPVEAPGDGAGPAQAGDENPEAPDASTTRDR